ncbi:nitroreductase [Notoacmeibacter sp. MSK16QG-6]|uniref:nitroreductase family protein n=1 Tax=Notoacmeibacter sp. MSK16QG-6 TaxID=2957982 RepID=UPI00209FF8CB|nr:nitroreductase [Notoacmeibacter sp. MSK16QG-6]MCP1199357.1 nitroreductase [Notoacmeibacter sp. MSK16QG-6]
MTNDALLEHLVSRRSPPIASLGGDVPEDVIRTMLTLAARVPDHGMLTPFRFILYRGDERLKAGRRIARRLEERDGPLSDAARQKEEERFSRAPLVIGVVFTPKNNGPKPIPEWEQYLSAGAVCMNLLHAASALGYRGNWITNWYSDDSKARAALGLADSERVAGFVHIGKTDMTVPDRERPDIAGLISDFSANGEE